MSAATHLILTGQGVHIVLVRVSESAQNGGREWKCIIACTEGLSIAELCISKSNFHTYIRMRQHLQVIPRRSRCGSVAPAFAWAGAGSKAFIYVHA